MDLFGAWGGMKKSLVLAVVPAPMIRNSFQMSNLFDGNLMTIRDSPPIHHSVVPASRQPE
jgi:hypothetical protein